MKVHRFGDSGEAYDASQCSDDIHDGDVLVSTSERAVAVLIEAWPTRVGERGEAFHIPADDLDWAAIPCIVGFTNGYRPDSVAIYENRDYTASLELARQTLQEITEVN